MPKVSVIIPTYNVEQYLQPAMDSVINQTLEDIEIICVDDGSTDNSGKILDQYAAKDSRVKVIHKENGGYGKAMNVGLDNATGEYIGILEPDDYVKPEMFESLYNKAKEFNLDLIKSDYCRFEKLPNGEVKWYPEILDKTNSYYNRVINLTEDIEPYKFPMNTWAGIYKRSYLLEHKIRHNETPGASYQDNGFWFQSFAFAQRAMFLKDVFYLNRRDNPNSSVKNPAKVFCMKEEYDYIKKILETNPVLKEKYMGICFYKRFENYIFTFNRIDIKYKKMFLESISKEFKEAYKHKEIDEKYFSPYWLEMLHTIKENPMKFYRKKLNRLSLAEKIFSIKNHGTHKIVRFLGFKLKVKSKKLIEKQQYNHQIKRIDDIEKTLIKLNKELVNDILKLNTEKQLSIIKDNVEKNRNELDTIQKQYKELLHSQIFNNLISNLEWIHKKDFIPTEGAATYSFLYILLLILEQVSPKNILEFGMGQTSKLTTDYATYKNNTANLCIIDHDKCWIEYFSKQLSEHNDNVSIILKDLCKFELNGVMSDKYENLSDITDNKKYDLIIIDGPYGYDRKYPRTNIIDLIPQNLSEDFIIILDDAERSGEKNTAQLIFNKLKENGIKYYTKYRVATKTQLVITSESYRYINFY